MRFPSPFATTPHPLARAAAEELMSEVRTYMSEHPESELHTRGKMFGVLVCRNDNVDANVDVDVNANADHNGLVVLRAFSAMLDGSYRHEGFVEPVYEVHSEEVIGTDREDSRRKQQWIFSQYRMLNARGEEKDLMEIFRDVPPILTIEEYFNRKFTQKMESINNARREETPMCKFSDKEEGYTILPPAGAGECCAPKLLQAAYRRGLKPVCMAEFWMGASPKDELRIEGQYYPACTGKCKPILAHTLIGLDVEEAPETRSSRALAEQTETIYEDEWLLVVNKPSGLLSVPGKDGQYSLTEYLNDNQNDNHNADGDVDADHNQIYIPVHRLDQDTSGLIVFAKTEAVAKQLQSLFLRRDIHKVYRAELQNDNRRVAGDENTIKDCCAILEGEGTIDLPLLPNPMDRPRQMVHHQHGKPAITHYRMTGEIGPHGGRIVELRPETGRTHQLRVHCAHIEGLGTPIYGDRLYGYINVNENVDVDKNSVERLMLHAAELSFPHPVTGEMLCLKAKAF